LAVAISFWVLGSFGDQPGSGGIPSPRKGRNRELAHGSYTSSRTIRPNGINFLKALKRKEKKTRKKINFL